MEAVAIVSIVAAALTVVVLAGYLIVLALILRRVNARLRTLTATLREVAVGTEPLGDTVEAIEIALPRVRTALGRFTGPEDNRPSGADGGR